MASASSDAGAGAAEGTPGEIDEVMEALTSGVAEYVLV
jgi:hypothetical protein